MGTNGLMSVREVTRRYNVMMTTIEGYPAEVEKDRHNCYRCPNCGHVTKTIDVEIGTTPANLPCENCSAFAQSTFYVDVAPGQKPTIEWYRPSLKQTLKLRKNPDAVDHILKGGLGYRKIEKTEIIE